MAGGDWRGLELATGGCMWLELIVTKAITEPYSVVLYNCQETKLFIKDTKKIFLTGIFLFDSSGFNAMPFLL